MFLFLPQDRPRYDVVDALRLLAERATELVHHLLLLLPAEVGRRPPKLRRLHGLCEGGHVPAFPVEYVI